METKLVVSPLDKAEADAVAFVLYESEAAPAELKFASSWLEELLSSGEFSGKADETAILHQPSGLTAKRLIVVGAGPRDKFDPRKAVAKVVRAVKEKGVKRLAWYLNGADAEAIVEGAITGNYEPDVHKTANQGKSLEAFHVVVAKQDAAIEKAFARGVILAESQNFTRDLANEPANLMTPTVLSHRARGMAVECGLECEILD